MLTAAYETQLVSDADSPFKTTVLIQIILRLKVFEVCKHGTVANEVSIFPINCEIPHFYLLV